MITAMKYGSLFSGIDGLGLGLEWAGFKPTWQVENDPDCIKVLEKHWPDVERRQDIYDTNFTELEWVDLICGGFPCQPFSHAGRRTAEGDDRYLWPQMLRAIREVRPTFVLAENVYGLVTNQQGLVLETVYLDLGSEGYEIAPPFVFPAAAVGAVHRRDRVWVCAYSRHNRRSTEPREQQEKWSEITFGLREVSRGQDGWKVESGLGRVLDGVPSKMERVRLKQLGNSVVPQAAYMVGRAFMESVA